MRRFHLFSSAIAQLLGGESPGLRSDNDIAIYPHAFRAGETISAAGTAVQHIVLICSGLAARETSTEEGGRALTDILLTLGFALLESLASPEISCDLVALTYCEAAFVTHFQLRRLARQQPELWPAFFRAVAVDNGRLRSNLCNLSRRLADARTAHFFEELYHRMDRKGLVVSGGFDFPVSQRNLADLLGMSLVHINRTLQTLRALDLLRWDGRHVVIPSICQLSDFANGLYSGVSPKAIQAV